MLSSSGDIYVINLTFTLYCGDMCGGGEGGGGQSRHCMSGIDRIRD